MKDGLNGWLDALTRLVNKPICELVYGNLQQSLPIRGSDNEGPL